jgi:hypothetical protein
MRNKIIPSVVASSYDSSNLDELDKHNVKPLRIKIKPSIYESSNKNVNHKKHSKKNKKQEKKVEESKNNLVKRLNKHYKKAHKFESCDSSSNDLTRCSSQKSSNSNNSNCRSDKNECQPLPNIRIAFGNILSTEENIECAVMKYQNFIHIWSSTKIASILMKDTQGRIKIKDYKDFTDKIVSGDITLFNVETGTMYVGIICVENNKLRFKFSNRPILPLCTNIHNVILQFNIYIN